MYTQLTDHIRQQVTRRIFHVTLTPVQAQAQAPQPAAPANAQESGPRDDVEGAAVPVPPKDGGRTKRRAAAQTGNGAAVSAPAAQSPLAGATINRKVGRNDPCPCGSGKKYKKCHGSGALV